MNLKKSKIYKILLSAVVLAVLFVFTACGSEERLSNETENPVEKNERESLSYALSEDGTFYICDGIGTVTGTDIEIADSVEGLPVKEIGENAFSGNKSLKRVLVSENVERIGKNAFNGCYELITVIFKNKIGWSVCKNLSDENERSIDVAYSSENAKNLSTNYIGYNWKRTPHKINKIEAANADCEIDGNFEYWHCEKCGKNYSDKYAVNEISEEDFVISAAGHDIEYVDFSYPQNEYEGKISYYHCKKCSKNFFDKNGEKEITPEDLAKPVNHNLKYTAASPAGCESEGNTEYWYCETCGKYFSDKDGNVEIEEGSITKPALGHSTQYYIGKNATCTENGKRNYWYCETCGKYFSDKDGNVEIAEDSITIPALGHSTQYYIGKNATCTENGKRNYWYCETCGKYFSDREGKYETDEDSLIIYAVNHNLKYTAASPAGCESEGNTEYWYCETCGKYFSDILGVNEIEENSWVTEATGHTFDKDTWHFDETRHWHPSSCKHTDLVSDKEQHDFIGGVCSVCGFSENSSGFKYTINATGTAYLVTGYSGTGTNVVVPDYFKGKPVRNINRDVFKNHTEIQRITIGKNVTYIGQYAFYGCTGLTALTIPDGVKTIYDYAFYGCAEIKELNLGSGLEDIGSLAFYNCEKLERINVGDLTAWCKIYFYDYGATPLSNGGDLYIGGQLLTKAIIPADVDTVKKYAFYKNKNLESAVLHDGVTSIGDFAFSGCSRLQNVTVPDGLTSIGDHAFENCFILSEFDFPSNLKSIGSSAFSLCSSLRNAVIPSGVTSISYCAFNECYSLEKVTIENGVKYINGSAFRKCSFLTSIVIPDSVTVIEDYAFYYCTRLKSVKISANISELGKEVFYNTMAYKDSANRVGDAIYIDDCLIRVSYCQGVFIVREGTKAIAGEAFYACTGLTGVVIPLSVRGVGDEAFDACGKFTDVYYEGGLSEWKNVYTGYNNYDLNYADFYWYSPSNPYVSGNYWHYENGVPVKW